MKTNSSNGIFKYFALIRGKFQNVLANESSRQTILSISSLAGAGLISVALRFVAGIIQGHFIGPDILGYYTKFTIIPGFLFFFHLGVFTSLARQFPYYIGKGDREVALSYASNALGWTHILCVLHIIFFLIPCLWSAVSGDWDATLGWGAQMIISPISLYMVYLGSTYRSGSHFVTWSKSQIISSVASVLLLPLVVWYQFLGLCARYTFTNVISIIYTYRMRPLKIKANFDHKILKKMIVFGFPLMVFAYISTSLWVSVEKTYILSMYGEKSLGVFVFAGTLCAALTTVASSISQVFQQKLAFLYGASGKDMKKCFRYCIKCSVLGLILMFPLIMLTYLLVDPVVRLLLPLYIESIPITRIICWISLIPVLDMPKQLLIVAKRTRVFGISVMFSFCLYLLIIGIFALKSEIITLQYAVGATVFCKFISVLISNFFSWSESKKQTLLISV